MLNLPDLLDDIAIRCPSGDQSTKGLMLSCVSGVIFLDSSVSRSIRRISNCSFPW